MNSNADRIRIFSLLLLLVPAVLLLKLLHLQGIQGARYAGIAQGNRLRLLIEKPERGVVFDRNGHILISNRNRYSLSVVPRLSRDRKPMLDLAARFGIPLPELERRLAAERAAPLDPVVIKDDLDINEMTLFLEQEERYPGIMIDATPRRFYPEGSLAAHLLGYVGEIDGETLRERRDIGYRMGDIVGKTGLESIFDIELHGMYGGSQVQYDASGPEGRTLASHKAIKGNGLLLTLDRDTQRAAEEGMKGRVGAVVAVDVRNGEVLAFCSSPAYDPNIFVDGLSRAEWGMLSGDPDHPLQNRASNSAWPPGSIFKMVTLSAALQEGLASTGRTFHCSGAYNLPGRRFRCWQRSGHGTIGVIQGMAQSCDVVFYQLGRELGAERLARYARAFGLGERSGLELKGESSGNVPSPAWKKKRGEKWYAGDTLNMAIGQGFLQVSPLQMALATGAVANGGRLYKPLLVKAVLSPDGKVLRSFKPSVHRSLPVDPDVLSIVQQGMRAVVRGQSGTGRAATIEGIEVAGKTGTAEDPPRRTHAWFVGYAPYRSPRVAVCVFIEQGGHGGEAAAPVAGRVLQKALLTTDTPLSP